MIALLYRSVIIIPIPTASRRTTNTNGCRQKNEVSNNVVIVRSPLSIVLFLSIILQVYPKILRWYIHIIVVSIHLQTKREEEIWNVIHYPF